MLFRSRACEEFGVRHGSQEGARRGRNTRRQIFRLIKTIEGGKRRQEVVVILQLDFVAAFTSARQQALRKTHEAYGMPPADLALIQRMQAGSWYCVVNPFGMTAACELNNGTKQGCPASPAFYINMGDPLLHLASLSGLGWRPPAAQPLILQGGPREEVEAQTIESDPMTQFVDDLDAMATDRKSTRLNSSHSSVSRMPSSA